MRTLSRFSQQATSVGLATLLLAASPSAAEEPPALNPFAPRPKVSDDAVPGYVRLSTGEVLPGRIYLTRDHRLKVYDGELQRQREIPLRVVQQVTAEVQRQWMEKEWRFKEAANAEKVFTGRSYPARELFYTIKLHDGRTITGPLSGVVYVKRDNDDRAAKLVLHKRQKGDFGDSLSGLSYIETISLGDDAYYEGIRLAAEAGRE